MSILCTLVPATGRFHVLAPLLGAIRDAGHRLRVAAPGSFGEVVRGAGFETLAAGLEIAEARRAAEQSISGRSAAPDELAAAMFMQFAPRALVHGLLAIARAWGPEMVLHEEGEYAGPLLAALLGVPNVAVGWPAPARGRDVLERLGRSVAPLWTEAGLEPPPFGGLYRHLWLDSCPAAIQSGHAGGLGRSHPIRPATLDDPGCDAPPPAPIIAPSALPLVHLTLGTVPLFNETYDLFRLIIDALSSEPLRLVVTVGRNNDPGAFGRASDRVWVGRYVPHARLLPSCDVVIGHGGAGTTVAALIHGLPQIVIPQGGASQRRNALACTRAGVGLALQGDALTADGVRGAVRALLGSDHHRDAARRVAREIAAMPAAAEAVRVLEDLAASAPCRRG